MQSELVNNDDDQQVMNQLADYQPQNIPNDFDDIDNDFGNTPGGPDPEEDKLDSKAQLKSRLQDIELDLNQIINKIKDLKDQIDSEENQLPDDNL